MTNPTTPPQAPDALRCLYTDHECGTDTVVPEHLCPGQAMRKAACENCIAWAAQRLRERTAADERRVTEARMEWNDVLERKLGDRSIDEVLESEAAFKAGADDALRCLRETASEWLANPVHESLGRGLTHAIKVLELSMPHTQEVALRRTRRTDG